MKVQSLQLVPYSLKLVNPLTTALGRCDDRSGIVVCLDDVIGNRGYGDASPFPGFSQETLAQVVKELNDVGGTDWSAFCFESLDCVEGFCRDLKLSSSAHHAVEQALLDLLAQNQGLSLAQLLNPEAAGTVATGSLVRDGQEAADRVSKGIKTLKMKLSGREGVDAQRIRIQSVMDAMSSDCLLRLDANRSLGFEEALDLLSQLDPSVVEFVEEPIRPEFRSRLGELRRGSAVPIALDESVVEEQALVEALESGWCDVVVIKPMMCGGLLRALRYTRLAQRYQIPFCFTSSMESVVGRLGTMHLDAAVAPAYRRTAGLDTGRYFTMDVAKQPCLDGDSFVLPPRLGQGIDALEVA